MRFTRSRLYKFLIFIGLFFIGTGYIDAHGLTALVNLGGNTDHYHEPLGMKESFDSSFNAAWNIYLGTWDTGVLNPYNYNFDFGGFKQSLNLTLDADTLGFAMPVLNIVTSNYGQRHGRQHQGVDLDLETGDTVVSAFGGVVRMSCYYYGYGNMVVVRHPNGLETLYGHMSRALVVPGQSVKAGDILGLGGNTGHSFGSHLHFEIRFMGHPIDPAKFIAFDKFSLLNNEVMIDSSMFYNNKLVHKKRSDATYAESHYKTVRKAKKYHVVRQGDTLSAIARKYHTSVSALCKLNRIKATTTLKLGRKLIVK